MGDEPTSEPNGLKVEFLVKQTDISNFIRKAEEVYSWFKVTPNFVGEKINVTKRQPLTDYPSGNDWRFISGISRAIGVMGNVAYPIQIDDATLTNNQRNLLLSNICIDFNIGDVDIDASREALSYDIRTIKTIKDKLNEIVTCIEKDVEKNVKNAPNLWSAIINLEKYRKRFGNILDLKGVQFNGKPIPQELVLTRYNHDKTKLDHTDFTWIRLTRKNSWTDKIERYDEYQFVTPNEETVFFISDIKRGSL